MNRSYSKIRHIEESNRLLEKRLLNEQPPILGMGVIDASNRLAGSLNADQLKSKMNACRTGPWSVSDANIIRYADTIHSAIQGIGTDEEKIYSVFSQLKSLNELCMLVKTYESRYKVSLYDDLDGDIDGSDWNPIIGSIQKLK